MKTYSKKAVIVVIIVNLILVITALCWIKLSRFDYSDHLDDAVITIDDRSVTLREFGYYIYEVEDFVQEQALIYDPDNPKHWWNTHFSAGMDSQFVSDYAKKVAINTCISDEIYYQEAVSSGITLSSDEEFQAAVQAQEVYSEMTPEQITATGINEAIVLDMTRRHALAAKYAETLIENEDMTAYSEDPQKLVNWDGAFYLEKVLPRHVTWTNEEVLDQITFGLITVNQS